MATMDPDGNIKQTSYDARGDVAKTWQIVTNPNDGSVEAIVTVNYYDALGQLQSVVTPERIDSTGTQISYTQYVHNAFGDVIQEGTNASAYSSGTPLEVYYDYDQAGRVWRTNSGDGVVKVYQYDLQGNQTAELTSQQANLKAAGSSVTAVLQNVSASQLMRTETVYNTIKQAVQQRGPTFSTTPGNLVTINTPFQFGNLSVPVPANAIYQQVAAPGGGVEYIVNPTTWANGGGYYQVSAPSAANPQGTYSRVAQASYQLVQQGTVYWNVPTDQGVTATFTAVLDRHAGAAPDAIAGQFDPRWG